MSRTTAMQTCLAVILLAGLVSCQKLPTSQDVPAGGTVFQSQTMSSRDSIPTDYGNLVAITNNGAEAHLWFEKPDKTIVLVRMNFVKNTLGSDVLFIPRK